MFEEIVRNISSSAKDSKDLKHTSIVNLIPFSNNGSQVILPLKYNDDSISMSNLKSKITSTLPNPVVWDYTTKFYIITLSLLGIYILNSVLIKTQH